MQKRSNYRAKLRRYDRIVESLKNSPVPKETFYSMLLDIGGLFGDIREEIELLRAAGLPLDEQGEEVGLKTVDRPIREQEFCIVDIETNGSKPHNSQIIEIGALKLKDGEVTRRFETFVYGQEVPEYITKITGIRVNDLKDAPPMKKALREFREFLGESVFVAHNVNFDYYFISAMMLRCNMGILANRRLCTIDLARKTIQAERYGLEHLNAALSINTTISHRAYADALTASKVFLLSLKNLPKSIKTVEQLIDFSRPPNIRKKRKKEPKNRERTEQEEDGKN